MNALRSLGRHERGQAVVMLALMLAGLLLAVGLAVDAGALYSVRRTAQVAADAAAWAGAVVLYDGGTSDAARAAALVDAQRNGHATGGTTSVTVFAPASAGPFAGDLRTVEVVIERSVRTSFLGAGSLMSVRVRAVGAALPFRSAHAILALSRDAPEALRTDGLGSLRAQGGGVMVNSAHPQAAVINGQGDIVAPYTSVVGGVSEHGNGEFSPSATTGATPAADPYKTLPPPSTDGLPVFSDTRVTATQVLRPGVYEGGITVTANGVAKLEPGTYVLRGGGLTVQGNGQLQNNDDSDGTVFFVTHDLYPAAPGTCGAVLLAGNGAVELRAPTSGPYAGILFYQDRQCSNVLSIVGNGSLTSIAGTIYAPAAEVKLAGNGNASLALDAQIIGNTVRWSGNGDLRLTYAAGQVGRPILPTLVE